MNRSGSPISRLSVLPADEPSADVRGTLDQVGAWFGFVPNMFTMLASNPTVLDLVMTVQMKASSILDARTRHTIALAVSEADGCDYFLALHTAGSLKGAACRGGRRAGAGGKLGRSEAGCGSSLRPPGDLTRGRVSDADLAAVQGAGYTDPQILAIVTLVVRALLTNYLNNVNLTDVDIPAPDLA